MRAAELDEGNLRSMLAHRSVEVRHSMAASAVIPPHIRRALENDADEQVAEDAPSSPTRIRIAGLLADSPKATVSDRSGFVRQQTRALDTLRAMVQLLVAMAIVIAVLGIVNTLTLSVIERTRELGLLRAIGLRRGQVVEMIAAESVIISVFGALLGVAVGVALGAATVRGLHDQGIEALGLPWGQIGGYLASGVIIGVIACVAPATRAARLDVLTATSYE